MDISFIRNSSSTDTQKTNTSPDSIRITAIDYIGVGNKAVLVDGNVISGSASDKYVLLPERGRIIDGGLEVKILIPDAPTGSNQSGVVVYFEKV